MTNPKNKNLAKNNRVIFGKAADNTGIAGTTAQLVDFTFTKAPRILGKFAEKAPLISIPFEMAEDGPIKGLFSGIISSGAGIIAAPIGFIGGGIAGGFITGGSPIGAYVGAWAGTLGLTYEASSLADKWADKKYDEIRSLIIKNKAKRNYVNPKKIIDPHRKVSNPKTSINKQIDPSKVAGAYTPQDTTPRVVYPTVTTSQPRQSFMSFLSDMISIETGVLSGDPEQIVSSADAYGQIVTRHSGGKVPGKGEVLALLKGGETVRTEDQEKTLQEQLIKRNAPGVSAGTNDDKSKPKKEPVLKNSTIQDEQYIINLIADAYKRNRYGFRSIF